MLSVHPGRLLERVRALCLVLPEAGEKISHGIPAFHVAGRMFAYFRHDHHGDGMTTLCVKTSSRDEQEMLIEADPDRYSWPAYIGPSGWVAISLVTADVNWEAIEARVRASYLMAAPRRLRERA